MPSTKELIAATIDRIEDPVILSKLLIWLNDNVPNQYADALDKIRKETSDYGCY